MFGGNDKKLQQQSYNEMFLQLVCSNYLWQFIICNNTLFVHIHNYTIMSCFNCVKTELHELAFQEECWVSIELTLISLMWSFIIDKASFFSQEKKL